MTAIGSEAPQLSVVITCTTAGEHVDRCIETLREQVGAPAFEVIVPVDASLGDTDIARWRAAFPEVNFLELSSSVGTDASDPGLRHLTYDARRAAGLRAARGEWIAMTEDHSRPARDWCAQIAAAHTRLPHAGIGGAIDNRSPQALTWAVYLSDFGRYQNPMPEGPSDYISDVNLSYKRAPLEAVADVWRDVYHETAVHGAMLARGETLWREPKIVVEQERGELKLAACLRERFAWGRLYAGKRAHEVSPLKRIALALTTPLLPPLMLWRQFVDAWTRKRNRAAVLRAFPHLVILVVAWSLGEAVGIWTGRATSPRNSRTQETRT